VPNEDCHEVTCSEFGLGDPSRNKCRAQGPTSANGTDCPFSRRTKTGRFLGLICRAFAAAKFWIAVQPHSILIHVTARSICCRRRQNQQNGALAGITAVVRRNMPPTPIASYGANLKGAVPRAWKPLAKPALA